MARRAFRTSPVLAHRSPLADSSRRLSHGFTIVELLIVVVVIAILAAVTIVGYNGINNRAKASAAASAAEQAAKKVMAYAITNSEAYPATLADAGITDANSTSYQYRVDNSSSPATFCLTATNSNVSYWASSTATTPAAGACAGHGANGADPITNLARNPHAVSGGASWTTQTPSGSTTSYQATSALDGGSAYQVATSVAGQIRLGIPTQAASVTSGDVITISVDIYAPQATQVQLEVGISGSSYPKSGALSVAAGWNQLSGTVTMNQAGNISLVQVVGVATNLPAGQTWRASRAIVTTGAQQRAYADGSSSGWLWNGTANNSTSIGSPL